MSLGEEGENNAAEPEEGKCEDQVPLAAQAVQSYHEDNAGQRVNQGCQVKVEENVAQNFGRVQGQTARNRLGYPMELVALASFVYILLP